MIKKFIKDSILYSLPTLLSRFLSFLLLPVYTRLLEPSNFGIFDLLLSFFNFLNILVAFEIIQGMARYLPVCTTESERKKLLATTFWFRVGCFSFFTTLCFFFADKLSLYILGKASFITEVRIASCYFFLNSIFYSLQSFLRWNLKSKIYFVSSFVQVITTALSTVFLISFMEMKTTGLLYGLLLGSFFGTCVSLAPNMPNLASSIDRRELIKLIKFSFPLCVSSLSIWINVYVDRFLINYFLGLSEVGLYGIGSRIAGISSLLTTGFQFALTPLIYTYYKEPSTKSAISKIFNLYFFSALALIFLTTLFNNEIVFWTTSYKYESAANLLYTLIPAILLNNMNVFSPGIEIAKKTYLIILICVATSVTNFILNILLIPIYNISGAGFSALASASVNCGLYFLIGKKYYKVNYGWKKKLVAVLSLYSILYLLKSPTWNNL